MARLKKFNSPALETKLLYDDASIHRARDLRDAFAAEHRDKVPAVFGRHIAKLLKLPNEDGSFMRGPTYTLSSGEVVHAGVSPDTLQMLEAMNGPHGWAVYKMLLARSQADVT